MMRFYSGPAVLIVDKLGYLGMPAEDAAVLSKCRRPSPGEFECRQYFRETANLRHLHRELEEAGEIEGEPGSGTRRE